MNYSNSFQLTDPWGLTYVIYRVTRDEALRIVEEQKGKELTQFSSKTLEIYYYLLDDNKVVCIPQGGDATVYDSYAGYLSNRQTSGMYIAKHIPNTYPVHHIHYLKGGRKLYYETIESTEAKKMIEGLALRSLPWGRKEKLYYLLPDGRVIPEISFDYVNRFASFQDYADYEDFRLTEAEAMKPGEKVVTQMCGRNPYGEQFPEHVEALCLKLPALLNAPAKVFDYSPNSLSKLDRYLYQHLITDYFADEVFLPLLAYAGQVNIKHKGCSWQLFYDEVWDSWVPDIQTPDGRLLVIYNPLLEILDSWEETECYLTLKMLVAYP